MDSVTDRLTDGRAHRRQSCRQ